jgi:hypothetical protein
MEEDPVWSFTLSGMNISVSFSDVLSQIDSEIERLQNMRSVLAGLAEGTVRVAKKQRRRSPLSPAARERIAAAQRLRWAKKKRARKN